MNTKIEIFLQFLFAVLAVTSALNHPYPDCIRDDNNNEILINLMSTFKTDRFCRRGHKLVVKSLSKFCCDTFDFSAVQASSSDEFLAFSCSNSVAPRPEDLLINGADLRCKTGETLKVFEVKVGSTLVKKSCCSDESVWPWSKLFFNFRSAPPFLLKGSSNSNDAKPLLKSSSLPISANECYFNDPTDKVNPLVDYMSKNQEGLSCRTNQIILNATRNGVDVYCCRYSSTSNLYVAEVLAPECVFEKGELLSLHARTPGNDLTCKDNVNYEITTIRTQHMVYDKSVVLSCCKKIETTTTSTTTPLPIPTVKEGDVCVKAGNDCVYHPDGNIKVNYMDFASKGAVCRHGQITRVETDYKNRIRVCCEASPNAPRLNIPPVCATTCSFGDGGDTPLRWSIMNYSPDLICRPEYHIEKYNTPEGEKCCCLDDFLTTTTSTTESTTTTTTTLETTTTTSETSSTTSETTTSDPTTSSSVLTTSSSLPTTTNSLPTTTNSLPTTTSSLTTTASTTSTSLANSTSETPTTTTKPKTEDLPSAATACNYDRDKKVLTNLMEVCNAQTQCRVNEVKVSENLNGKEFCCCDLRKELPPPSEKDPKLIAPKCYYDQDGKIVPFSALSAGLDLICKTTDTMVTNKDEKEEVSCCLLRNVTTTTSTTSATTAMISTTQGSTTTQGIMNTTSTNLPGTTITTIFFANTTTTTKLPSRRKPSSKMPSRVVKQGECPDCIMPKSAQDANIKWVIAHLERPGPSMGFCPNGWTMRRIYPVVERKDLTATKCCCESDAFPLPVKLGG